MQSRTRHPRRARATLRPSERRRRRASARPPTALRRHAVAGFDRKQTPCPPPTSPIRRSCCTTWGRTTPSARTGCTHRRPADRVRARRLPAPLHGAGGDRTSRSPGSTARRYIATIEAASPASGLHFIDPDTALNPHSLTAARHAAGAVVLATDLVDARRMPHRVLRGAPAGPPRRARPRDGLLPLQQRRRRRRARARRARPRARRDRRFRRPSRQRHRGHLLRRPARADGVDVPASAVSVLAASTIRRRTWSTSRCAAGSGSEEFRAAVRDHWLPALERASARRLIFISAGFDAHREDPLAGLQAHRSRLRVGDARARRGRRRGTRRAASSRRSKAATRSPRSAAAPPSTCASCSLPEPWHHALDDGPAKGAADGAAAVPRRPVRWLCGAGFLAGEACAADAPPRCYARTRLVDVHGRPTRARDARRRDQLRFPVSVRGHAVLPAQARTAGRGHGERCGARTAPTYAWQGGVGRGRATSSRSPRSARTSSRTRRATSRSSATSRERSATSDAQVIHCCADHSVYDPAQGARVLSRARRRSRSPRSCSITTPPTDELVRARHRRRRAVRRVLRQVRLQARAGVRRAKARAARSATRPSCASSRNTAGRRSSAELRRRATVPAHVPSTPRSSSRDLRKTYGDVEAVKGISFAVRARHDDGAARRQRRRQDDDAVDAARRADADRRARSRCWACDMPRHRHRVLPRMNFTSPYVDLPKRLTVAREPARVRRSLRRAPPARAHRRASPRIATSAGLLQRPYGSLSAGPAHARVAREGACSTSPRCCCSTSRPRRSTRTSATGCAPISSATSAAAGCTMLLASHHMGEVERMCDDVIMLRDGRGRRPGLAAGAASRATAARTWRRCSSTSRAARGDEPRPRRAGARRSRLEPCARRRPSPTLLPADRRSRRRRAACARCCAGTPTCCSSRGRASCR